MPRKLGYDQNRRAYIRHPAEKGKEPHFFYDVTTEMDYQIRNREDKSILSEKCTASIKNVSAVGLCFVSEFAGQIDRVN